MSVPLIPFYFSFYSSQMARSWFFFYFVFVVFALINFSAASDRVAFYGIKSGNVSVKFTNWGASIVSVILPDREGKLADVALGYDKISSYTNDTTYFGATVGRVANRIGGAKFTLHGKTYKLVANEGNNTLHGGHRGFGDVIWTVLYHKPEGRNPYIIFTYRSFDGEQGFPGDVEVSVKYMISGGSKLYVNMKAEAINKETPINLAQHVYWNLGGHNSGDVLSDIVQIFGSHITPVDKNLIPTGQIVSVEGTPYDFRTPASVGSRINQLPNGYDINYAIDAKEGRRLNRQSLKKAAIVYNAKSGRVLQLWTNQPGLQFYTGNMINDVEGKDGAVYHKHAAMCLETQGFPDSVNKPDDFPSQFVYPGETYKHSMVFEFSTRE